MTPGDAALVVGATARVTRLVTTDIIGDRYMRTPVEAWAHRVDGDASPLPREHWRTFIAHGLACPHCVSVWAAAAVLTGYAVLPRALWRWGAGALTASYLAGHTSARLD